jgi:hypothetical protein
MAIRASLVAAEMPQDLPSFHNAIESAVKLRNSILVEVGLLLAAATAAPLLPLLLTIFSPEELILRVIKVLF